MTARFTIAALLASALAAPVALAQTAPATTATTTPAPAPAPAPAPTAAPAEQTALAAAAADQPEAAKAPDKLVLYFDSGSAAIRPQDMKVLDQASRLYRDGNPLVMIVSGASDLTGLPQINLHLSQMRAENVMQGLVARGIPIERFQILAKGESAPAVPTGQGVAEPSNRRVEISWR